MVQRKRRKFTAELKAEVVELCPRGDPSIGQVSKDLGLARTSVRARRKQAEVDPGGGPPGELTTAGRAARRRLRRDARRAGSFSGRLERGLSDRRAWPTRRQAIEALDGYIQVFYDTQWLRSTLGYRAPAELEPGHQITAQAAQRMCPRKRITLTWPSLPKTTEVQSP